MKSIMFVCTGNICRSPMAHFYMQKRLNDLGIMDILVSSCGTYALDGDTSTNNAIEVMKSYGVDLTKHRATNINSINIEDYDLVLCLTFAHKINVLSLYPKLKNRVFTIIEYLDSNAKYIDIDDPWGYNSNIYDACAKQIVSYVDKLIDKIVKGRNI